VSVAISDRSSRATLPPLLLAVVALLWALLHPPAWARGAGDGGVDHLVVSEVVTGGSSASDELIELYNPAPVALPLEGLELIYVSSTGGTVSRRTAWPLGAPSVQPGGHVLVGNEAGIYASIADALYATGMASTGGSVAIRVQGAGTAIDAVGWGSAASTWREGGNAPAPTAGSSIERLPGGGLGSTQDTDDNATDFAERPVPDPQNLGSAPTPSPGEPSPIPTPSESPAPSATTLPTPTTSATESPSPSATASPSASPTPGPTPGADPVDLSVARAAPDGSVVTIEATALTASDFHDGGGFVADSSGGIAVILDGASFARGDLVRISGTVDDRFSQRTIRAGATGMLLLGTGTEPEPIPIATGSVVEPAEGALVSIAGTIDGGATALTSGTAYDVDDGSGAVRVIVPAGGDIDLVPWTNGTRIEVVGVVGQRDSSGSGTAGYRVMLRDARDIREVGGGASPTPSASPSPSIGPSPTPEDPGGGDGVISIGEARLQPKNARVRVRGVVTLAPGTVDAETAAIQDASGAILLRLGEDVGTLRLGERIEVAGTRSTKSGMETLRVTEPPVALGAIPQPEARVTRTAEAGEALEAHLLVVRGALVESARRASAGSVSFEVDDGSGPLRVSIGASLEANDEELTAGTWVEVRGVLGQETTGAQPLRGYRLWPRAREEVRVVASVSEAGLDETQGTSPIGEDDEATSNASLDDIGGPDLAGLRVGATLVVGPWPEMGIGGLLWDGSRLVAIEEASSTVAAALVGQRAVPIPLELGRMRAVGVEPLTHAPLVSLGTEPGDLVVGEGAPVAPRTTLPAAAPAPLWVSVVGRLVAGGDSLTVADRKVEIERRCGAEADRPSGMVGVTAVLTGAPARLIAPCGGIRAVPAVGRSGSLATAAAEAATLIEPSSATTADAPHGRRFIVAGLLLLAAVVLAAAALAGRRYEQDPRIEPVDQGPAGDDAGSPEPVLPRLTLVSVPREHGP
jgi:hypothetical protein